MQSAMEESEAEKPSKQQFVMEEGGVESNDSDSDGYVSPLEAKDNYDFDDRLPYLMRSKRNWKFQQLVDILLLNKSERICTARPVGVTENCAFLINTSKLAILMTGKLMIMVLGVTMEMLALF